MDFAELGRVFQEAGITCPAWLKDLITKKFQDKQLPDVSKRSGIYRGIYDRLVKAKAIPKMRAIWPLELTDSIRELLPSKIVAKEYGKPNITLGKIANCK